MDFDLITGFHFNGSAQFIRLLRDAILILLCLYEIVIKRRNGIIFAIIVISLGDIINAAYSVFDSLAIIVQGWQDWSSLQNPSLRGWIIGTGVWIANLGWLLMFIFLWITPKKDKK
jgi:hypothetical protein